MQGNAITINLSRPVIYRYDYDSKLDKHEEEQETRSLTSATRYENDVAIRTLSVNCGYFTKSKLNPNPRWQKDMILNEYVHSIDTDIFKLRIEDLRTHTKIAKNMDLEKGDNVFLSHFKLVCFRHYTQFKQDYVRCWRQTKAKRGCSDFIEYVVPFVYGWMFAYVFAPLYILSRFANISLPFVVFAIVLIAAEDVGTAETVSAVINIGFMIILGIVLCTKIRKLYVILIFNVGFGVLDMQVATGYDGSPYYAMKYILNYYDFARLLQTIKPMLIDIFGNDIASVIIHYWLSFDDRALKDEQTPLRDLITI